MGMRMYRLKRSLNNLAFRMSIVKLAPGSSRPLLPIAMIFIVGFTTFVTAGGLFILVQPNTPLVNRPGGFSFVYPGDIHNQTTQEFVFAMVIFGLGLFGLYLMHLSTRYAYRPARAYSMLLVSMVLIVLFIGLGYLVLYDKIH